MSCLRRLDLSENPIGDRGFEILWRVYCRAPPIHLPKSSGSSPIGDDGSDDGYDSESIDDGSDEPDSALGEPHSPHSPGSGDSALGSHPTPSKSEGK